MIQIKDLFDLKYGSNLELYKCNTLTQENGGIPFVARSSKNNGIITCIKEIEGVNINPKNTISVAVSGSVMSSFYQEKPYYSGRDIYYLTPKINLNKRQMLYYCLCLERNKYKYNYGRGANKTLPFLFVPTPTDIPKWVNTIKFLRKPSYAPYSKKNISLTTKNWKYFEIKNLFSIEGSKTTSLLKLKEYGSGKYPYVTTQATNNGVDGYYNFYSEEGNVLVVDSAVLGYCSYQAKKFSASDHVEKLVPKFTMNQYIAVFIVTVLNLEQYRYNYGRKSSQVRMTKVSIKLPVDKEYTPDWQFMEDYIKSLPCSSNL